MKYHRLSCEMNFSTYYVVLLFFLQIKKIRSEDDCFIENFPAWDNTKRMTLFTVKKSLQKTDIGEVVFNEACQNINDVEITSDTKSYFDISFEDDSKTRLIMKATDKLSNIDRDYPNVGIKMIGTITMIKFKCKNNAERVSQFTVNVYDVNSESPEFSKPSYEFKLPMPMPAKIPLTMFGEYPIMIRDKDFSTSAITLKSDYENLELKASFDKNKNSFDDFPYTVEMNFNSFTRLEEDTEFKIYATDNGYPETKTSEIKIKFLIDHQESEYVATFQQPSFLYNYDQDKGSISAESIDVTIVNPRNDIQCEVPESYRDYFETPVLTEEVVKVQLKGKLPDSIVSHKTLRVTLTCAIENGIKSSADVLIAIPEISVLFSKSSYSAKYIIEQGVHKVDMTDIIEVIRNADHIVIEVENEYHDYFQVDHTDGSNQWLLKKKKDLTEELLENISLNIIIDIKSSSGTFKDKAIIMLLLPNGQTGVKFMNSFTTGNYVVDENGQGKLTADIEFDLNSENVKVNGQKLLGEYAEYFEVNYQKAGTFTVALKGDLPKEALNRNTILLTLQVDLGLGAVSQTAEATFVVQITASDTTSTPSTTTQKPTTQTPTTPTTEHTTEGSETTEKPTTQTPTTPTTEHTTEGSETTEKPTTQTPTTPTTEHTTEGSETTEKPTTQTPTTPTTEHTTKGSETTEKPTTQTPTTPTTEHTTKGSETTEKPTTQTPTTPTTEHTTKGSETTEKPTTQTPTTQTPTTPTTDHTTKGSETTEKPTTQTPTTQTPTTPTTEHTTKGSETTVKPTTPPTTPTTEHTSKTEHTTKGTETTVQPTTEQQKPTTEHTTSKTEHTTTKTEHTTKRSETTEPTTQHPTESTTKKAETTDDCDQTVWVVVTVILCLLLVLYIGASLLYYFKRLRNKKIDHDIFTGPQEENDDHYRKKTSQIKSSLKNVATRRPTGYITRSSFQLEKDDSDESYNETEKNTIANGKRTPPPPPMPTTDNSENITKSENTTKLNETLADALKKAVLERESRLI